MLREVLPLMFPTALSHGERVHELLRLRHDDMALLIDRLDGALQAKAQLAGHMTSLADELLEAGKR